jgi:hypothetical protein
MEEDQTSFLLKSADPDYTSPVMSWDPALETFPDNRLVDAFTCYFTLYSENLHTGTTYYSSKENILKTVFPCVLPISKEQQLKSDNSCISYLDGMTDLFICYVIHLFDDENPIITKEMVDFAGISVNELHEAACRNIINKAELRTIFSDTRGLVEPLPYAVPKQDGCTLALVTLHNMRYGAGILAGGQKVFQRLSEAIRSQKYFIMPSSIHEVILFPDNGDCCQNFYDLNRMLKGIPDTLVDPKEHLTDNIYHFDSTTGCITQYK